MADTTTTPKPRLNLPGRGARKLVEAGGALVREERLTPGGELPLVVRPASADVDLADWARHNAAHVEQRLATHGAVLFRDFAVTAPVHFEQFASALCPDLFNENGEHPRRTVSGKVYTPVFYPPDKQLLWHNENSFNHQWPTRIWFGCLRPADAGGETPLADSRRVYEMIDPAVRREFEARGVMYVRNYGTGLGLDWQTVFRTDDPAEVERRCHTAGMACEWKSGGRLKTSCVRPAAVTHPRTGERVWFNQAQHWHVACLAAEDRAALTASFAPEDLPRHCYFGDGGIIEDSVMDDILAVYQELEVVFPWQRGDIVMVDNLLTAHGRNRFEGAREMLVAMGAMMTYGEVTC
ncbi:MAG TPA: TauD/TfdA family dioxygenase [Pyrinomonadaceae bacterium]|jgi:alpha-ketoglutarate-dependent taurine dioxygenase